MKLTLENTDLNYVKSQTLKVVTEQKMQRLQRVFCLVKLPVQKEMQLFLIPQPAFISIMMAFHTQRQLKWQRR